MKVYVQKDDEKARMWAAASAPGAIDIHAVKGSPFNFLVTVICSLLSIKKPYAVVFRYLNDYESFVKSFVRAMLEAFCIVMCKARAVRVVWICHNIDKETKENYPAITRFRRWALKTAAVTILVTDEILLPYMEKSRVGKKKAQAISFGRPVSRHEMDGESELYSRQIKEWMATRSSGVSIFVGGTYEEKTKHFEMVPWLAAAAEAKGVHINIVVCCGNLPECLKSKILTLELGRADVLLINKGFRFDEAELFPLFDYNFKVYDDFSTPFSIYSSAAYHLPILTFGDNVVADFVREYCLGLSLPLDENALPLLAEPLNVFKPCEFLKTHSWSSLKRALWEMK